MPSAGLWLSSGGTSLRSHPSFPVGARSPGPSQQHVTACSLNPARARAPAPHRPPKRLSPSASPCSAAKRDGGGPRPPPGHPRASPRAPAGLGLWYLGTIWQRYPGGDPGAVTRPAPCAPPARRPSGTIHSRRPRPFSSPGLAPRRHQLMPAAARGKVRASLPRRHRPAAPSHPSSRSSSSIPSGAVRPRSHGGRRRQRLGVA